MNQASLIREYGKERSGADFNPYLFTRTNEDIIQHLKNVILSCQREGSFTIKVESFEVIEDYEQILKILHDYEESTKSKNKKRDNPYDFIDLKDSDVNLLVVHYYIAIRGDEDRVTVYIAVPRIVDKYYFRIAGNIYSAMYQIVDGSTYNNSTSNAKSQSITLKTMFMPTRIYKTGYTMKTTEKESKKLVFYLSRIFNKNVGGMKYILAKYGLYGTYDFLNIHCIRITAEDPQNPNWYTFAKQRDKEGDLYVSAPKYLFDNEPMVQSLVCTIYRSIMKETTLEELFTNEFWVKSLGAEFNNFSVEKGEQVMSSIESIYDISTKESIKLPEEDKCDTYAILRWMMREFTALKAKDNLDISTKKIRYAEYIASLYAMKISRGIYRVADLNKRATIDSIKKAIITQPTLLLRQITKCKLINYRNMVNDMDALTALKFTYKGIAGLGENNSNSIPDIYRHVNVSHIGRVDMDSSSATDPGVTGTICPLTKLYDGSFSDFDEPNSWEEGFEKIMADYKKVVGMQELATFKKDVLGIDVSEEMEIINESVAAMTRLSRMIITVDEMMEQDNTINLEAGGMIVYEC